MPERVVFDCNIFLQYLLNRAGPAGACVSLALTGKVELLISSDVLLEIAALADHEIARKNALTPAALQAFSEILRRAATFIDPVPAIWDHPIDPDDSCYINLALAGNAKLIVSRDRHLLNLGNPAKPWARSFRTTYPQIQILTISEFLARVRS